MIEINSLHLIDSLFKANEKDIISIKNCWEAIALLSLKGYCSSREKFFHNFKR